MKALPKTLDERRRRLGMSRAELERRCHGRTDNRRMVRLALAMEAQLQTDLKTRRGDR